MRLDLLGFAFYWYILSFLGWVCLGVLGCAGVCWGVLGCAIKSPPKLLAFFFLKHFNSLYIQLSTVRLVQWFLNFYLKCVQFLFDKINNNFQALIVSRGIFKNWKISEVSIQGFLNFFGAAKSYYDFLAPILKILAPTS